MNNPNCGGKVQLCAESRDFGGKRFEIVWVIFSALEEYFKVFFHNWKVWLVFVEDFTLRKLNMSVSCLKWRLRQKHLERRISKRRMDYRQGRNQEKNEES